MALFYLILLALSSASLIKDSNVYILTTSNIEEFLSQKDALRVIFFYLKFSKDCQTFKSIYEQVATDLSLKNLPITFGKIETSFSDNNLLVERFKPKGCPHVSYFLQNTDIEQVFNKTPTAKSLTDYLISKLSKIILFSDIDEYEKYLENQAAVLGIALGIFESFESSSYKYFEQVANSQAGKYNFAAVEDKDGVWGAKFDIDGDAVIAVRGPALLGQGDRKYVILRKPSSEKEIVEFLGKNRFSFLSFYSKETEEELEAVKRPLIVIFLNLDSLDNIAQIRYIANRLRKAIISFKTEWESEKKFTFAIGKMQDFMQKFINEGVPDQKAFLAIDPHKKNMFILPENELFDTRNALKGETIQKFLKDFQHDNLSFFVKSEEEPEYDYKDNVRVLVGKNMERIITKTKQDILLYIYVDFLEQPQVREAINALALKYRDSDKLMVAQIDSSKNDLLDNYKQITVPSIYYITSEKKFSPILFPNSKSEITFETIEDFISQQAERKKEDL